MGATPFRYSNFTMVRSTTFDLFNFCTLPGRQNNHVQLQSHPTLHQILLLKREFFVEVVCSSIAASSGLHPIYCSNTNPMEIADARNNNNSSSNTMGIASNVHLFLTKMTNLYSPSITLYRVLSSTTYSLFTFYSKSSSGNDTSLGWIAYICDPTNGLVILFVLVNKDFQKKGIGTSMLQTLQYLSWRNLGTWRTLVWYTKLSSNYSNG